MRFIEFSQKKINKIIIFFSIFCIIVSSIFIINYYGRKQYFEGEGTLDSPYVIDTVEKLLFFRDSVNEGECFENKFFIQMCDLDLECQNWLPIGMVERDTCFKGVYNGNNYKIKNLYVKYNLYNNEETYPGFFGRLEGTVLNLAIESGHIEGDYCGSIASACYGNNGFIINCYNKAEICGNKRAGGICDDFSGGCLINCFNDGKTVAPTSYSICGYDAKKIVNAYGIGQMISAEKEDKIAQYIIQNNTLSIIEQLNQGVDFLNNNNYLFLELSKW